MKVVTESEKDALLIRIAWTECDHRMSGPDGDAFGFCQPGYPEIGSFGGLGDTELEAAITFLREIFG